MAANKNSILEHLSENNPVLLKKIENAFALGKKLDFWSIQQKDVIMTSPQKAFEYAGEEGDKYFKVWMVGNKIAWCTWANTMIDGKFHWNTKARNDEKRDNNDIIGNEPYISAYLKSNSAIEQCTTVYMFPFSKFTDINKKAEKKERAPRTFEPKSEEVLINELLTKLDNLSSRIEDDLSDSWTRKNSYPRKRSEFDNALMRLKVVDNDNPMIPYYTKRAKKWDEKSDGILLGVIKKMFDL